MVKSTFPKLYYYAPLTNKSLGNKFLELTRQINKAKSNETKIKLHIDTDINTRNARTKIPQ